MVLLLGACSVSRSESLTGEQLQALVNQQFMSPQIRKLEVIQPFVNVQLYLQTPVLTLRGDGQPLGFSFRGELDADIFSDFLEDITTEPVGIRLEGSADLEYRPQDHAFYFSNLKLDNAHIDLEIAMVQALLVDQLKKALKQELSTLPIIPLTESSPLYKKLQKFPAETEVKQGVWVITAGHSEGA